MLLSEEDRDESRPQEMAVKWPSVISDNFSKCRSGEILETDLRWTLSSPNICMGDEGKEKVGTLPFPL
jgi:hypothetical protein